MLSAMVLLAAFNGLLVGLSRAFNARLSAEFGPFKASLTNHLVGFALVSVFLVIGSLTAVELGFISSADAEKSAWLGLLNTPLYAFLGGAVGAVFVAINSYVLVRLGAARSAILVVSGQMVGGVLLDISGQTGWQMLANAAGVALIIYGIYLSVDKPQKTDKNQPNSAEYLKEST